MKKFGLNAVSKIALAVTVSVLTNLALADNSAPASFNLPVGSQSLENLQNTLGIKLYTMYGVDPYAQTYDVMGDDLSNSQLVATASLLQPAGLNAVLADNYQGPYFLKLVAQALKTCLAQDANLVNEYITANNATVATVSVTQAVVQISVEDSDNGRDLKDREVHLDATIDGPLANIEMNFTATVNAPLPALDQSVPVLGTIDCEVFRDGHY